ncbi:sterol regulatory element-binding ECM22 [Fusarium subglutinans]|uniref:Sterol regulatory element-binding ECM22 n=1 Tax=Gibberella subglutinans TaxID=42677 RepID=A0A8H5PZI5_GIBSU|nr:sterol regulatory element-binding ECM22 [Fusarium subglutinans]KAF5606206.1 sterol regulatory element-binding ECM22 [Fusarium subglutinans]
MTNNTQTPEGYAPFDLYPYNPSQGPAYAFLGLLGAAGIAHFIMMFPYRSAFPIPMIIGCGMEAAAYWFRSRSHDNLRQTLPCPIQNLLVLVAPPFLAATIYMSLGRITRALKAQEASLISLRWITKLFVLVDLICFATQTAGAIMSGSEDLDEAKRGQTIIIGAEDPSKSPSTLCCWSPTFSQSPARQSVTAPGPSQVRLDVMGRADLGSRSRVRYTNSETAKTLSDGSGSETLLWSEGAPRVGFQHNCILELILSLSSFHLARVKPNDEQRYSLIAETHLTAALQPAMILISNLDGDNSPAAYLTSVLICFVALAKGPSPGNLLPTNIEGQVSWLHLLRGVRLVVESAGWSSIFSGMLAEYAPKPSSDTPEQNATTNPALMVDGIENWHCSLNGISNLIAQLAEEKLRDVYDRELQALTACFERTFCKGQDAALDTAGKLQDVIGWVYRLEDEYMEGLRQGDLISAVILGHFCVLLRTVEAQFWFMHGWAAHVIGEILVMSPDARQWLSWPIAYLNQEK